MNTSLASKVLVAGIAIAALSMCEGGLQRATRDKAPLTNEMAPDPATRSGSAPEGGASSPSGGRVDMPPEQPRR